MYAERWQSDDNGPPPGFGYYIGLDLGQSQDFTAISIIEKVGSEYHIRKLERTRGTPYPQIVVRVKSIMQRLRGATLIADATGVGAPVIDMFEEAGLRPVSVHIHGGSHVSSEADPQGWMPRRFGVPKRDLVAVLQVLLQNHRLKVAPGPLSDVLAGEMLNFRVTINPETSHDSFSAWREQDHDDLVLATALACWWAENRPKPPLVGTPMLGFIRG